MVLAGIWSAYIDNEIYKQVAWESELNLSKKEYVGKELGIERMYTWYRELQDFDDGSMLLYYNELPKDSNVFTGYHKFYNAI